MSQSWTADLYTPGTVADTTLSNMELMFATLKSSFSGASAPGSVVAGQLWYDTAKTLLKHRNNASSAWRGVLTGTAALKVWLYLNVAQEGWALDASTGADNVLAIKGGSAAYNVNGGNDDEGSWTISGITTQDHTLIAAEIPAHVHTMFGEQFGTPGGAFKFAKNTDTTGDENENTQSTGGSTGHNHGVAAGSAWRPDAAVGRLFYPDV